MGGGFWQGFVAGAAVAGINIAANEIAGEIKNAQETRAFNKGVAKAFGDYVAGESGSSVLGADSNNVAPGNFSKAPFDTKLADYFQWYVENVAHAEIAVSIYTGGNVPLPKNMLSVFFIEPAAPANDLTAHPINESSVAMRTLLGEATGKGEGYTSKYTWAYYLHVHPPRYFHIPAQYAWMSVGAGGAASISIRAAGTEIMGGGPSNPGDNLSYPGIASSLNIVGQHPSLGVLDSDKSYYEYRY
jgi:hypothetical protein